MFSRFTRTRPDTNNIIHGVHTDVFEPLLHLHSDPGRTANRSHLLPRSSKLSIGTHLMGHNNATVPRAQHNG